MARQRGRSSAISATSLVLFLLIPAAYGSAADIAKVRQRTSHDVPRLVADRIATSARIGTVYVFNYEPVIYYLADAPPPTRYVLLPADITARKLVAEVRRILGLRPSHIVVTDSPVFFPPQEVQDIVEGELAKFYVLDSEFIDSMTAEHVRLYRYRVTPTGTSVITPKLVNGRNRRHDHKSNGGAVEATERCRRAPPEIDGLPTRCAESVAADVKRRGRLAVAK